MSDENRITNMLAKTGSLILTRRVGESILVGNDIIVTVVGDERGRIRIRVTAPRDMEIDREEIRERKLSGEPPPRKLRRVAPPDGNC